MVTNILHNYKMLIMVEMEWERMYEICALSVQFSRKIVNKPKTALRNTSIN